MNVKSRGQDRPMIWCGDCYEYYEVPHGTLTAKCPAGLRHEGDKVPRSPALIAVTLLKSIMDGVTRQ